MVHLISVSMHKCFSYFFHFTMVFYLLALVNLNQLMSLIKKLFIA